MNPVKKFFQNYKNAFEFFSLGLKKFKRIYFSLLIFTLVFNSISIFLPILTKYQTDQLVSKSSSIFGFDFSSAINVFIVVSVLIFLVEFFQSLLKTLEGYIREIYIGKIGIYLRQILMGKLGYLPLGYYLSKRFQKNMPSNRSVGGFDSLQNFVFDKIGSLIQISGTIFVLNSVSPKLLAIVILTSIVGIFIDTKIHQLQMKNSIINNMKFGYRSQDIEYNMNNYFDKVVSNGIYNDLMEKYKSLNEEKIGFDAKNYIQSQTYYQISSFVRNIGDLIVKIFLGISIISHGESIGTFAMVLMYLGNVSSFFYNLFNTKVEADRLIDEFSKLELFLRTTNSKLKNSENKIFDIKNIELKNLSFAYPMMSEYEKQMLEIIFSRLKKYGEKNPAQWVKDEIHFLKQSMEEENEIVLENINLIFEKGKSYAIVGHNGAGKTTLVSLIQGYFDEFEGDILIDGEKINNFNNMNYLSNFGVMNQNPFMMQGFSIRENLIFGTQNVDDEKIFFWLEKFGIKKIIEKLPDGIDTLIGYNTDLSGGQIQILCLIRLILQDKNVLIIDEGTNQLDARNESLVIDSLLKNNKNKIVIFISHRMSSIRKCDQIICMQQGKITDIGTHTHLMKTKNPYHEFVDLQMGKDE